MKNLPSSRQLFVIEPIDRCCCSVRVVVSQCSVAFALAGILVTINPYLGFVRFLVNLEKVVLKKIREQRIQEQYPLP